MHNLEQEEMIYPIKSIFHIQFDGHTLLFAIQAGVYSFLDDDNIIHDLSASNETALGVWDDFGHDIFHFGCKDFGKDFIWSVT